MSIKCNKGYPCGLSCISISYSCKKNFPIGISISLNSLREVIITTPPPPKPTIKVTTDDKSIDYTSVLEDGTKVYLGVQIGEKIKRKHGKPLTTYDIEFKINDSFDMDNSLPKKTKLQAARQLKEMFTTFVSTLKNGDKLQGQVYDKDGNQDKRSRAYEKLGFNTFEENGNLVFAATIDNSSETGLKFSENYNLLSLDETEKVFYEILYPTDTSIWV